MVTWSQVQRNQGKENYSQDHSPSFSLSLYDQYFLFMIHSRLGCTEIDLAVRFNKLLHHLEQLIVEPTRISVSSFSLIDVLFVNNSHKIADSGVIHLTIQSFLRYQRWCEESSLEDY